VDLAIDMTNLLLGENFHSALLSLFSVAYKSRVCLPMLISAGFMMLDLHMRLELEIEAHVQQEPARDDQQEQEE